MQLKTYLFNNGEWNEKLDKNLDSSKTLVIVFGSINISKIKKGLDDILSCYSNSTIIGCSTAGEIYQSEVFDDSISISVIHFEKSRFRVVTKEVKEEDSFKTGKEIVNELKEDDLKSIFILSNVLSVNGSELTKGINENLPKNCAVTGGLAGDGVNFNKTWIIVDNQFVENYICIVGLYGDSLRVNYGCKSGWRRFGIDRKVTHSFDNILYSLDNKPALELYKKFLGRKSLSESTLNFPLMVFEDGQKEAKFRAIKAINEENSSIILAGNIPQNSIVSFAMAKFDDLINGAEEASEQIYKGYNNKEVALCLGVSCIARRVVLKQQVEDELEAIVDTLGKNVSTVGFYSYGEFSKGKSDYCDFHNQTMALTLIYEVLDDNK
ncbi:MAG: FIST N-terminal domain-containing protein [Campylobacterota bacterium]|nr:FIST N-terminal domain-containing protein [Campylobacterota bacterium]